MYSVKQRADTFKQPKGGFIGLRQYEQIQLTSENKLFDIDQENIAPQLVGLTVDYLTRLMMGEPREKAFGISMLGVQIANDRGKDAMEKVWSEMRKEMSLWERVKDRIKNAIYKTDETLATFILKDGCYLLAGINGLDDESIISACRLVTFDVFVRNPLQAELNYNIEPNDETISNIREMVQRGISFFNTYGPVTETEFGFNGGYTSLVSKGDGDFLTKDCLWDFKVSKSKPTTKNSLQILMYWIMGKHSGQETFKNISKMGIFNPRLNMVYLLDMHKLSDEMIRTVEREVIGYSEGEHIQGFSFEGK